MVSICLSGDVLRATGLNLPFFANRLRWLGGDRWKLDFPFALSGCAASLGNCKCSHRAPSARETLSVVVGDGRSDFCICGTFALGAGKGATGGALPVSQTPASARARLCRGHRLPRPLAGAERAAKSAERWPRQSLARADAGDPKPAMRRQLPLCQHQVRTFRNAEIKATPPRRLAFLGPTAPGGCVWVQGSSRTATQREGKVELPAIARKRLAKKGRFKPVARSTSPTSRSRPSERRSVQIPAGEARRSPENLVNLNAAQQCGDGFGGGPQQIDLLGHAVAGRASAHLPLHTRSCARTDRKSAQTPYRWDPRLGAIVPSKSSMTLPSVWAPFSTSL